MVNNTATVAFVVTNLTLWICAAVLTSGGSAATADVRSTVVVVVVQSLPKADGRQMFHLEYEMPMTKVKTSLSRRLTLHANSTSSFAMRPIPSSVDYVLFQAHSQALPLILSYEQPSSPTMTSGRYVNSTNAGLVVQLAPSTQEASIYVHNPHDVDVETLLVVIANPWQDPVPGGCNMEFEVEVAPYLRVNYDPIRTTVDFQRSLEGSRRDDPMPKSCDHSVSTLEYAVYQRFLKERDTSEDEYFGAIEGMLTVDSILRTAIQSGPSQLGPMTRVQFTSNAGQGVVFNVVVRSVYNRSFVAAYTPAATYACDLLLSGGTNSCKDSLRPMEWMLCIVCALVGLFLCFFGHRFFKTEMFIFGFLAGALLGFILFLRVSDSNESGLLVDAIATVLMGFIGGIVWTTFWWFAGVPILSMLLVGLLLGFQLACVVFYTKFRQIEAFANDFNYGMTFACFVMVPPLFMLCCLQKLSIVSCAVIGSYGAIVPIDRYLGSSLTYIVLNPLRRATVPEFHRLNAARPFQNNDVILSCVWILLAIAGIVFQTVRERKRPPFPPPPYTTWRVSTAGFAADYSHREEDEGGFDDDDERRPLLNSKPQQRYEGTASTAARRDLAPPPPPVASTSTAPPFQ